MGAGALAFESASAAREARPLSRSLIAGLFLAIVFLLFAISSGVLWTLGLNYNGVTGAVASKSTRRPIWPSPPSGC